MSGPSLGYQDASSNFLLESLSTLSIERQDEETEEEHFDSRKLDSGGAGVNGADNIGFAVADKPSRFFGIGRVFKTLWIEPAGSTATDTDQRPYHTVGYGQQQLSYAKVRRFVVIRKRLHSCLCLMISTYGGQGAAKKDARSQDHAVVYSAAEYEPRPRPEENLTLGAFPIIIEEAGENLDARSRVDFGKVYTVEHNVKVLRIGRISPDHIKRLNEAFATTLGFAAPSEDLDLEGLESHEDEGNSPMKLQTYEETSHHGSSAYSQTIPAYMAQPSAYSQTIPAYMAQPSAYSQTIPAYMTQPSAATDQSLVPSSTRSIRGTAGESEKLDLTYSVRKTDHRVFFKIGRVFSTLWTDSVGGNADADSSSSVSVVLYGEKVYTKVRRFVVVREGDRSCTCLPITSYGGASWHKRGISLADHGFIYSRKMPKRVKGMRSKALKIDSSRGGATFAEPALVNYAKVYTVETNVKVKDVGKLDSDSKVILRHYFRKVFSEIESDPPRGDMTPRASTATPAGADALDLHSSPFAVTQYAPSTYPSPGYTVPNDTSQSVYYGSAVSDAATPANEYTAVAPGYPLLYTNTYGSFQGAQDLSPLTIDYGPSTSMGYAPSTYMSTSPREERTYNPACAGTGYTGYTTSPTYDRPPESYPLTPDLNEFDLNRRGQGSGYTTVAPAASNISTADYGRYVGGDSVDEIRLPSLEERARKRRESIVAPSYTFGGRDRDDRRRR